MYTTWLTAAAATSKTPARTVSRPCREEPDFWALPKEDALQWEQNIVREMTPMIVADLIPLAAIHKAVICKGDIDIDQIVPIASHTVTISNHGTDDCFFACPEQQHMLDEIHSRPGLSGEEKQKLIKNA